jgi:Mg2+-importing ATPase
LKPRRHDTALRSFIAQFTSPLVLILVFAAVVSAIAGEWTDAAIVVAIVVASAVLSFAQEYSASHAVEKLRAQVTIKATVLRDSKPQPIPAEEVVPGDIVLLSAGSLIPADGIVLEAKDFFVNQAVLTGETFPVEKKAGPVDAHSGMIERINMVFMGTSARSGNAHALVVHTRRPFFRSTPGRLLWISTLAVSLVTLALPYLTFGKHLGFTPLPTWVVVALVSLTGLYVVAADIAKKFFYERVAL